MCFSLSSSTLFFYRPSVDCVFYSVFPDFNLLQYSWWFWIFSRFPGWSFEINFHDDLLEYFGIVSAVSAVWSCGCVSFLHIVRWMSWWGWSWHTSNWLSTKQRPRPREETERSESMNTSSSTWSRPLGARRVCLCVLNRPNTFETC